MCQTSHPEPSQKTMWRFKFLLSVALRTNTLPSKPCGVSSFFCANTFPENVLAFQGLFCTSRNKILPSKPCGVSSLFLCQPAHPDPSQKTMSLFKLFFVDLRTINSPRKPCIVSLFFGRSACPPRTFPAHHLPFQVFALPFTFRNLNYNWNQYVRTGEGLQKHLMKPNTLAQSSSHALADKGWPGRWHHSTTLCSPMQKIRFGPMCSPPCSASSFPAPRPLPFSASYVYHTRFASPGTCP